MGVLTSELDKLLAVALLLCASLLVRQAVIFSGQTWIRTFSHTLTLLLLPLVTYSLTSVISGNIALSLGMVGALSIVRFRNPVKSPLELVTYFLMISCGIAAAVSVSWLVLLVGSAVGTLVVAELFNRWSRRVRGVALYTTSFTEGNALHTLEVFSETEMPDLLAHAALVGFDKTPEGIVYRFASPSRQDLLTLSGAVNGQTGITRIAFAAA
ncbi:DUF4956 domain-containing protein [Ruegeria pomeroyi]|nr:DUF4956 domain-containing protein [Ruegeria pomeroyi]NVK95946.1 DUF4956 domain-containing protein [Ruegeria pomeroyi]NVL00075.1 DUF4956 domain-containing protein [Ruegeria pomeroyi]